MKFFNYFLLMSFVYSISLYSREEITCADIEWKPLNELHITLFSYKNFEQAKGGTPETYNSWLENAFKRGNERAFQEETVKIPTNFPLTYIDILTPTKVFNGFVLKTSSKKLGGSQDRFEKLLQSNPPSLEKGHHWYLVIKMQKNEIQNSTIDTMRDAYIKAYFRSSSTSPFLPHITIGEITAINDPDCFLEFIAKINKKLAEKQEVSLRFDKEHIILKLPSPEHSRPTVMLTIKESESAAQRISEIQTDFVKEQEAQREGKDIEREHQEYEEMLKKLKKQLSGALVELSARLLQLGVKLYPTK